MNNELKWLLIGDTSSWDNVSNLFIWYETNLTYIIIHNTIQQNSNITK